MDWPFRAFGFPVHGIFENLFLHFIYFIEYRILQNEQACPRPFNRSPFQFQDIAVSPTSQVPRPNTDPLVGPVVGLSIDAKEALRLLSTPQARNAKLPRPAADFLLIRDHPVDRNGEDVQAQLVASFTAGRLDDIGIVPEIDVFRGDPYLIARAIASLDILSKGRAGFVPLTAPIGSLEIGYARTASDAAYVAEFVAAVDSLWNNWQPGALARDWKNNHYIDRNRIREANHEGPYFSVKGPLPTPTAVQDTPPVIARRHPAHAGISDRASAVIHDEPATAGQGKSPALLEILLKSPSLPDSVVAYTGVILRAEGGFADWAELVEHTRQAHVRLGLEWRPSAGTLADILARPETSISEISHV